jgi:DNA-binding transcriptional LysR family regulator
MDLDLGCVADFLVLLEVGGYHRAAVRLHLSASALSRRIQRLEHQVGVPLVVRGPTGTLGATSAGLAFAEGAGPLLQAARAARASARTASAPVVRLGLPGGPQGLPGWLGLPQLAAAVRARMPGVRLIGVPLPFPAMYDALIDNVVDVVWGAVGDTPAALELVAAGAFDRVAVLPVSHPLAKTDQLSLADLVDLPLQHNPAIPAAWMAPFLLDDIRPLRQARLVEVGSDSLSALWRRSVREQAVHVASWVGQSLPPGLQAVPIAALAPCPHWVAHRRTDRRGPTLAVAQTLAALAAAGADHSHATASNALPH